MIPIGRISREMAAGPAELEAQRHRRPGDADLSDPLHHHLQRQRPDPAPGEGQPDPRRPAQRQTSDRAEREPSELHVPSQHGYRRSRENESSGNGASAHISGRMSSSWNSAPTAGARPHSSSRDRRRQPGEQNGRGHVRLLQLDERDQHLDHAIAQDELAETDEHHDDGEHAIRARPEDRRQITEQDQPQHLLGDLFDGYPTHRRER